MAASYNPQVYTALINMEHIKGFTPDGPFRRFGMVEKLEAEEITEGALSGKMALYGWIAPTDDLVTMTSNWQPHRLITAGIAPTLGGLCLIVASVWTSPPSLTLFLGGGVVAGGGGGAIVRGSLALVIATADSDDRAGALATFFTAGYAGLSVPALGVGILPST